ncbi:flagellar basal body rod protein FlgB [Roseateles depolymerans]|uniref:Flagellar basal body rod protein FlgB n=1 Tax=Roseateles depolymerans TaxID=76731 RepID=A0A0U3CBZ8_9BURK|nr:flagellar basal body rod protein FlgB [Roseateles depolymerans]ALV06264.1 Flagellar basal body rod protein FlgB [Roseateles depolymerans]REG19234.1 flagellar basal-body rod protein FlgB [Roseateles depolymerans]
MMNRLTDAMNFQAQALTLRAERQRLLASNIANADTPGYQSRDLDFAKALREATSPAAETSNQTLTQRTQGVLQNSLTAMTSMDSNTVDMDRERASFADNTVKYEASLRFINGSVRTLMDAMKSPNAA